MLKGLFGMLLKITKILKENNDKTLKAILETHNRIDNLGQHVSKQDELINNTFASQMVEFEEKVQNSFNVVEGWVNELDTSVEDLYLHIDVTNQGLDKKLSDRIKDHKH